MLMGKCQICGQDIEAHTGEIARQMCRGCEEEINQVVEAQAVA